jgi:hypothetical protein
MLNKIPEGTLTTVKSYLRDGNGLPLVQSDFTEFTLSLYDKGSNRVINLRNAVDVCHGGAWDRGVTIVSGSDTDDFSNTTTVGVLTILLTAADNVIVNPGVGEEVHVIRLTGKVATAPYLTFERTIEVTVENATTL